MADFEQAEKIEVKKNKKSPIREIIESVVIAVILAVIIRTFIVEPFYIPSGSMEPTLMINDRIIVSKVSYYFGEPERGDIVVFKYPKDPSKNFVKRLIGKPGDVVELRSSKLYVNGQEVPENYLLPGIRYADYGPVKIPDGHYLMLGDNRNNSEDSRYWGFLPEDLIIGKAVLIYWPIDRIGVPN
ncbi:MAG: signal peptidase I [Desulfotomaculum sp.]|nr:signal peptidase I [Desulfotomaculum sp.]